MSILTQDARSKSSIVRLTRAAVPWALALLALQGAGCGPEEEDPGNIEPQTQNFVSGLNFSKPIAGLSSSETARFNAGKTAFSTAEDVDEGLGPVFNDVSCVACHGQSGTGGGSERVETRWGNTVNGVFDPLASKGGSLQQDNGIGQVNNSNGSLCAVFNPEAQPANSNTIAFRRTTPLFGLGLVNATPDSTFTSLASTQKSQNSAIAGRVNMVSNPDKGGATTVGKFGWKAQVPTLHVFSGDAYLNEMGVTSAQFPNENCPQGNCALLACNPVPDLNDEDGADVAAFADFMTMLSPPARGSITSTVTAGDAVFKSTGCAFCHVPDLKSGSSPIAALANKTYHPYSDFLLHDMGNNGDGIGGQGQAKPREMRTAPLWGVRGISRLLHGATAVNYEQAIQQHGGQGSTARSKFNTLSTTQKNQLFAFLNSL
jgi:CxxC motif-containing protein (DUF1111 family)